LFLGWNRKNSPEKEFEKGKKMKRGEVVDVMNLLPSGKNGNNGFYQNHRKQRKKSSIKFFKLD